MKKIFQVLGIAGGTSVLDKVAIILQLIQALASALTHLNEKLNVLTVATAAAAAVPVSGSAPAPAPAPAADDDLVALVARVDALSNSF